MRMGGKWEEVKKRRKVPEARRWIGKPGGTGCLWQGLKTNTVVT